MPKRASRTHRKSMGKPGEEATLSEPVEKKVMEPTNRDILMGKLDALTSPVMDRYGVTAFDELAARLGATIKAFSDELGGLFSRMVSQSQDEHDRLKSLMTAETADLTGAEGDADREAVQGGEGEEETGLGRSKTGKGSRAAG